MDVYEMREFLDEHGGEHIKIIAKVCACCPPLSLLALPLYKARHRMAY